MIKMNNHNHNLFVQEFCLSSGGRNSVVAETIYILGLMCEERPEPVGEQAVPPEVILES